MIRRLAKFILPASVWSRLRLWRETRINRKVALRFLAKIEAHPDGSVSTPMDDQIVEKLAGIEPGSLLEVGSGGGRLTHQLTQLGWKITGIEPDPWYRKITSNFFENSSVGNCQIVDGDIHDIRFADNSFDVVICNAVIEHVANPAKGVSEVIRCARKRFIITTPYGHEADSPDHIHHFYEDDLDSLFGGTPHESEIVLDRPDGNRTWLFVGTPE